MTQTIVSLARPLASRLKPRKRRGKKRQRRREKGKVVRGRKPKKPKKPKKTRKPKPPKPVKVPKSTTPTARELHYLNRLGTGFSTESFAQLQAAGGADEWFEQQLDPGSVPESATGKAVPNWFPSLFRPAKQIWDMDQAGEYPAWEVARDLSNCSLLRRIYSSRTVFENMVELWSNHFHVQAEHFPTFAHRPGYDATIRQHALGKFSDLLVAVSLHPAMLLYLNNYRSVRNAPNENQGRELLELHTVGVGAGYTEQMVKDSAKILSGHTVAAHWNKPMTFEYSYDPTRHTTGAVSVLGFTDPNKDAAAAEGLAERYLRHLAKHPATARRVARKLAVRFVSDDPSDSLLDRVAQAYLDNDTDIKATLRALVATDEFKVSAGQKFRTPADDVVATARALGVVAKAPTSNTSFANALSWTLSSTLLYQWPRPDGMPDRASTWATTTRLLNSWAMHWNMGGGWWPNQRATFRAPESYLPAPAVRFDALVDHLSRTILGRPASATVLEAAVDAIGRPADEVITADSGLVRWEFPPLLAVLLDGPEHLHR